jgi:hypothetical protein
MTSSFIRTVTINGKPLVLRFNKVSDIEFEVLCLNEKSIDNMTIGSRDLEWSILSGGNEEIRQQSSRIIGLLDEHYS